MKATDISPTHGFWIECAKTEFFEMIARNRIKTDRWGDFNFLSTESADRSDENHSGEFSFFLGLTGKIELGEKNFVLAQDERESQGIEPFEFEYLYSLQRHHDFLLRDPNVMKSMFSWSTTIPVRIDSKTFGGWTEFQSLESRPIRNSEFLNSGQKLVEIKDWDDDTLAWQILLEMEDTSGNELNTSNDLEGEWLRRRDNNISIKPRFFPACAVPLSELKARRQRANNFLRDAYLGQSYDENRLLAQLSPLDVDALLEICFLDHFQEMRVTKLAGTMFLDRISDSRFVFN